MKKRTLIIMFAGITLVAATAFLMAPYEPISKLTYQPEDRFEIMGIKARFWQNLDYRRVQCLLCIHLLVLILTHLRKV